MKECFVKERGIRFSRTVYGFLILFSFIFKNQWLVLTTSFLMYAGALSLKFNIFYQIYLFFENKMKGKEKLIKKDCAELSFACGMGGTLLLFSFLLFFLNKSVAFANIIVCVTLFLMLIAGLTGMCTASLIYLLFKKIFKK